jgi:hypothetical protein
VYRITNAVAQWVEALYYKLDMFHTVVLVHKYYLIVHLNYLTFRKVVVLDGQLNNNCTISRMIAGSIPDGVIGIFY